MLIAEKHGWPTRVIMQNNETRPQTSADILMAGTQRMPGGHHGSQAARQPVSQAPNGSRRTAISRPRTNPLHDYHFSLTTMVHWTSVYWRCRPANLEQSATWPANTWHQLHTVVKHYWRHRFICLARPRCLVTYYISALEILLITRLL